MAVPAGPTEQRYVGNGVSTIYTVPFLVIQASDLAVYVDGVKLTSGYTQSGVGNPTSSVTFTTAPANLAQILFTLEVQFERLNDYQENGDFLANTVNNDFDRIWQALKQLYTWATRSLRLGTTDVDGQGWYRAKNNGIRDLRDPELPQDAATRNWSLTTIASIINGMTGNPNLASNVFYQGPDGLPYVVQDMAVKNNLLKGGWLIAWRNRTVGAKLDETRTIDDYPDATDLAKFNAMLADTGGLVRLGDRDHTFGNVVITGYPVISVIGAGMPVKTFDLGRMQKGTCILGGLQITANTVFVKKLGLDQGIDRAVAAVDGLVVNSVAGQDGVSAIIENVASLGATDASMKHAILVQGFNSGRVRNCYVGRHQFGVVVKCRNFEITGIEADEIRTAAVYPKGDKSADAGFVASGICSDIQISNVRHNAKTGNIEAAAVYCHASTDVCSNIQINNVRQNGGLTPLRVQGSGVVTDPPISGIQAVNIDSSRAQTGTIVDGFVNDVQIKSLRATNPRTGQTISIGSNVVGWVLDGVHSVISDPLAGTSMAALNGIGTWSNFSARGGAGVMTIDVPFGSLGTIAGGNFSGNCRNSQDVALVGINGFTAADARLRVLPGKLIKLAGSFTGTLTNKAFCNIGPTGKQQVFACGAIISGAYASVTVRLNDFQLTVEPSIPAGLSQIFLDGITIQL